MKKNIDLLHPHEVLRELREEGESWELIADHIEAALEVIVQS